MILSGREKHLRDSRVIWSHIIDSKPYSYEEKYVAPPVVRQTTPPSTNSEGAIVHRDSSLWIQWGGETSQYNSLEIRLKRRSIDAEGADGSIDCTKSKGVMFKRKHGTLGSMDT